MTKLIEVILLLELLNLMKQKIGITYSILIMPRDIILSRKLKSKLFKSKAFPNREIITNNLPTPI